MSKSAVRQAEDFRLDRADLGYLLAVPETLVLVARPLADLVAAGAAVLRLRRARTAAVPACRATAISLSILARCSGGMLRDLLFHGLHRRGQLRAHAVGIGLRHLGVRLAGGADDSKHLLRTVKDDNLTSRRAARSFPPACGRARAAPGSSAWWIPMTVFSTIRNPSAACSGDAKSRRQRGRR